MKNCKVLAMALALLLIVTMVAGCGGSQDVGGKVEPLPGNKETTAATQNTEENTTEAKNDSALGRMDGGVYTNQYAGFGCTLDDSWSIMTAEELQELPDDIQELFSGTELGDNMDKYSFIVDISAENVEDLTTMNVLYQKMDLSTKLAMVSLSEEEVIDAVLETKDMMIQSYTQAGMEVQSLEKAKVNFLGEEHFVLKTVGTSQGVACYILQVMDYQLGGNYSVTLTVSSYVNDTTQELLDLFYAV